jgi:hypothetical protein
VDGAPGVLRELGGGFWHISFHGFADIVTLEALGALIHLGVLTCACGPCEAGIGCDLAAGPTP